MLLQSDIERAMRFTRSNKAAARFLRVDYLTYRKYARMYFDETGKSLFEKHKNQGGIGIAKIQFKTDNISIEDVLNNLHPDYPLQKLKGRLVAHGYLFEKCELCGFEERRLTDSRSPVLLNFKDKYGDFNIENLQMLCLNCYFLTVDNIVGKRITVKINNMSNQ